MCIIYLSKIFSRREVIGNDEKEIQNLNDTLRNWLSTCILQGSALSLSDLPSFVQRQVFMAPWHFQKEQKRMWHNLKGKCTK